MIIIDHYLVGSLLIQIFLRRKISYNFFFMYGGRITFDTSLDLFLSVYISKPQNLVSGFLTL